MPSGIRRKNLLVPVTCLLLLGSHAAGANPRQITGDWTVEGQDTIRGEHIRLDGALILPQGAKLILKDCTLEIRATRRPDTVVHGQRQDRGHKISVDASRTMYRCSTASNANRSTRRIHRRWRPFLSFGYTALILTVSLWCPPNCFAQNPIVQSIYTADPAPLVHQGAVYLYTGHDEDDAPR
jgi:hypothetical protein